MSSKNGINLTREHVPLSIAGLLAPIFSAIYYLDLAAGLLALATGNAEWPMHLIVTSL